MKKYMGIFLSILFLVLVAGCSGVQENIESGGNAVEIAASIAASQDVLPQMSVLSPDHDYFTKYLNFYKLDRSLFEDGAIGYAGGVEASEIAVLVVIDEAEAEAVEKALISYIERRVDSFRGYVPDQAALAEKGIVVVNGRYVALLITKDNETARIAFLNSFDESWAAPVVKDIFTEPGQPADDTAVQHQETETAEDTIEENENTSSSDEESGKTITGEQSEKEEITGKTDEEVPKETEDAGSNDYIEDVYDKDAILAAWQTGDTSLLSLKNLMVYKEAAYVIEQLITPQLSDLTKERVIHDYIIDNGKYDPEELSNAPDASPDPDNDNPYGMLINGVGICSGYSSTFQLFMDMLEITCITVDGFSGGDPHAWNMVQLDGSWYCVDVTWDDTNQRHRFFNVTSEFMRATNHQWDETNVPEAVGE